MTISQGLAEGQVLQRLGSRGATVEISGQVSETAPLLATIAGAKGALKGWKGRRVGKSARGNFSVILRGIPAGGPYRLELQIGKEKTNVRQFFVGDVWVLAGQSNMEGSGNMPSLAKPHPRIRNFSMRREWRLATDPLHLKAESPDVCHNEGTQSSRERCEELRHSASKGSGVGIHFAREMLSKTGVPQGLIATAHGGTSMSQWDPIMGEMYHSMLDSVKATGQPVAGLLWYQGESDTTPVDVSLYQDRMKALVAATRRDFRLPNLPWVIVQISRVLDSRTDSCWNDIQELQRLLPGQLKNFETVSAIDLPLDDGIHIGADGFPALGSRMAIALGPFVGGTKMRALQLLKVSPSKSTSDPTIEVSFTSVHQGLKSTGNAEGFSVVNAERKPLPVIYKTTLHGNVARLHCGEIPPGAFLHYGFGTFPVCNITDGRNLALPVFGPIPISSPIALLPFVMAWKTTGLLSAKESLKDLACPDVDALGGKAKTYTDNGFINERAIWKHQPGQNYFSSFVDLSEPMKLRFLLGYDGPFRLWLDDKPFFQDLKGTNPCIRDQAKKSARLPAGRHRITVAMDTNGGAAWGFMLCFVREDVSAAQLREKNYTMPSYSV